MSLVKSVQPRFNRVAVAIVGTLVAATLSFGVLAVGHSAADDGLAGRKIPGDLLAGKPIKAGGGILAAGLRSAPRVRDLARGP